MKIGFILIISMLVCQISGQIAFVVNSGSQTLTRIDLETNEVDNAFAVLGNAANRVAVTDDYLYVVNSGDNNIQKIDIESGNTVSYIYIGPTTNPYDIRIIGDFAYVTGALSNKVYKVDLTTSTVMEDVIVEGNPAGMAVWGTKLYVGNTDYAAGYINCSISVIDLETFSVIENITTDPNPQFLLEFNNKIHISCTGNWVDIPGSIQIVDPATDIIIETLNLGGYPGSLDAMENGIIYVGDSMSSGIYAYDSETYEIIYDPGSPFLPGAATVFSFQSSLYTLGGEWGQNFEVNVYDQEENLLNSYLVGLYATDLKVVNANGTNAGNNILDDTNLRLMNYPNPFNPNTVINFQMSAINHQQDIELVIYNIKGKLVKDFSVLLNSVQGDISNFSSSWNGTDNSGISVPSGIYLYQLRVNNRIIATNKCLLMK